MQKLKDIKQEILDQHRQLALNRRELSLRRIEIGRSLRRNLYSKGALGGAFALGLLLGWWARARPHHGGAPLFKGMRNIGHWLLPAKGVLWNGLIRTAAERFSGPGEKREQHDQ